MKDQGHWWPPLFLFIGILIILFVGFTYFTQPPEPTGPVKEGNFVIEEDFIQINDRMVLVGIAANRGNETIESAKISASFFDNKGDIVAIVNKTAFDIQPGGLWEFRIVIPFPERVAKYEIMIAEVRVKQ